MQQVDRLDIVAILLIAMAVVIAISLYRLHLNKNNEFDLSDLITHKGHVDNAKFCQMAALVVSSWVVYYMTLNHKLTEWAFGLYMGAWVGARAISLVAAMKCKTPEENKQ